MPDNVSRTFDTKEEAEKWIEEIKEVDNVKSSNIEKTSEVKWKAIVEIE